MTAWQGLNLPNPADLKVRMRKLAALDILLCDEDWLRVHRYDAAWQPGLELACIDNGAGDQMFVLFSEIGTIIQGFDHESSLSPHVQKDGCIWPGMYDGMPDSLFRLLQQHSDELGGEDVTFCLWRRVEDHAWLCGTLRDLDEQEALQAGGADFLFGYLGETSRDYIDWAQDYYGLEHDLPLVSVSRIFGGEAVDEQLIADLHPERDADAAMRELQVMGWPVQPD
ncbi:hypothetical protein [Paenibacillus lacisoli]|nr:hypothetical protein [Paenibacillus sp. JX-17]